MPGLLWLKGPDVDSAGNWGSGGLCHRAPACVHVVSQNAWGQAVFPRTNLTVGLGLRASLGLQAPSLALVWQGCCARQGTMGSDLGT